MTVVMPPGPVLCIGGTKYPHCNYNCNCSKDVYCSRQLTITVIGVLTSKSPFAMAELGLPSIAMFLGATRVHPFHLRNIEPTWATSLPVCC